MNRLIVFVLLALLLAGQVQQGRSQQVRFSAFPAPLQLFARDEQDSAIVPIEGILQSTGYDSVHLQVFRNTILWKTLHQQLVYSGGSASFRLLPTIAAGLFEYDFRVFIDQNLVMERDSIVCGDVYLINGQSNSHPNAISYSFESEFCRSFGRHTNYNDYNPADTTWGLSNGQGWCDSCLYAVGTWGLRLQELILNDYGMPTCVINGGSGGSTISYNLPDSNDHMNLATTYGRLLYRSTKAGVATHVKALLWHQGESDSGSPDAEAYYERFSILRNAWKEDYTPLNKIYVFQIHPGNCGGAEQDYLRNVQRLFKADFPEVEVMATVGLDGHDGCHYNDDGYLQMASWVYRLMERDFYHASDTLNIEAPDIQSVYYRDADHTQIAVEYDNPVVWPDDSLGASMKDYFYLDGTSGLVQQGYTINDGYTVILQLNNSSNATKLTYLPSYSYNHVPTRIYEGPWIRGLRGVGALSFFEVPISANPSTLKENQIPGTWFLAQNYPNPFGEGSKRPASSSDNPETTVQFGIPLPGKVSISVYNAAGQKMISYNRFFNAGIHAIKLNAANWASGLYFYRIQFSGKTFTRKMTLIR